MPQFGADSSVQVSSTVGAANTPIITYANAQVPNPIEFWGRYFGTPGNIGGVRCTSAELPILRAANIKLLPIAQQTHNVAGTSAQGKQDAANNRAAIQAVVGTTFLQNLKQDILLFLDVEGDPTTNSPSLGAAYWEGWSAELLRVPLGPQCNLLPSIYATSGDGPTWQALAGAVAAGAQCYGAFIAHWITNGGCHVAPAAWNPAMVTPGVHPPTPIFGWQFVAECPDYAGVDLSMINPDPAIAASLLSRLVP